MKKRILALLCVVAVVVGVFAFGAQADTSTNYRVGYSIQDINPWLDPKDHSKGIIPGIEMKGRGANDSGRYATYIHDDDGDGNVTYKWKNNSENAADLNTWTADADGGDGLHATCIAITDSKDTTVLFISLDMLGAYPGLVNDVRTKIVDEFTKVFSADVIRKDNIILSGSHTHSAFNFGSVDLFRGENAKFREYYDYVLNQITASAVEAYNDRAVATMSKGSIDAGTVAQSNGKKYQLNFIRHYQRESYDDGDYYDDGTWKQYAKPYEIDFVQGSNFGRIEGLRRYIGSREGIYTGTPKAFDSSANRAGVVFGTRYSTEGSYEPSILTAVGDATNKSTADDVMHLIQFEFADNLGKDPIVMLNWRAHTTEVGNDFLGGLSSDYVGPLRAMMKKDHIRMSFFLGGAGDLIINQFNSQSSTDTPWRETVKKGVESDVQAYGRLLYKVATDCLTKNMTTKTAGDIQTASSNFVYNRQVDSDGLRAALLAVKEEHPDDYRASWDYYPYSYQYEGKTYIINSYFHAGGIEDRMNNTEESTGSMTLTAVTLGKAAAFVTAPFEIADRYDSIDPLNNSLNDWKDLATKGFGTPFVLSCTNGYSGYIPYSTEYIYNTEEYTQKYGKNELAPLIFGPGTYEANITPATRFTGEAMVARMGEMLTRLYNAKSAYCKSCDDTVLWQPFTNDTTATEFDGHYYLTENIQRSAKMIIYAGESLCLDLNGKSFTVDDTAFHPFRDASMSLLDSVGGGKVIAKTSGTNTTQYRGGAVLISSGSTFNLYGGTLTYEKSDVDGALGVGLGGVVCNLGMFNMYGGVIEGAELVMTAWKNSDTGNAPAHNGYGAAVYVDGTMNVSGGTITAGTVPTEGEGRCVVVSSATSVLNLSGNAVIDEIMLLNISNRKTLNVTGEFTGSAAVALGQDLIAKSAESDGNGLGAHVGGIMKANAMPYHSYSQSDPNTPISNGWVLYPDTEINTAYDKPKTLLRLRKPKMADCDKCGRDQIWTPVYNTTRIPSDVSGHYYLAENITAANGIKIIAQANKSICLDLNGKTYEVNDTAIHPYQQGTISVVDHSANKNGQIISHPGTQTTGGVILISANSTVNIYAGTLSYAPTQSAPTGVVSGGVAYINNTGVLNVYGGTLRGATLVNPTESTVSTKGLGATVTVLTGGKLNVAGGELTAGTAPRGANCVYLAATGSKLELSRNGSIAHVQANWSNTDMITVKGEYTGHTVLQFNATNAPLSNGKDIGNSDNATFGEANLTIANPGGWSVQVSGTDLVLSNAHDVAIFTSESDEEPEYHATLNDALLVYEGGIIRLINDVAQNVHITKDVYLDLSGCDITGTVTVDEGKTLYCMDNTTDDYAVTEDEYGKISSCTGTGKVTGISAASGVVNKDYLKITEEDKTSFHRVNLKLTHMTLIPEVAGIKYKSAFEGDQVVARNVESFGIAFNLSGEPSAETMIEGTYSKFTTFKPGAGANGTSAGTLLKGVMKNTNTDFANGLDAKRPIYGSAYIKTKDGIIFGSAANRSLRQQIELVDDYWATLSVDQKNATVAMYRTFINNMQYWDVPYIKAAAGN